MVLSAGVKPSPMMEQWLKAKSQHQDAILLFRMGDFYELFGDDAIKVAPILELALTSRDKDKGGLKMAGFPFHAADSYIERLLEQGMKVAVCEQLEDPKLSRGVVKRGITNVLTPGTAVASETLTSYEPLFLLGIAGDEQQLALCALDMQTATFQVTSSSCQSKLLDEAVRLAPKEVIVLGNDQKALDFSAELYEHIKRLGPLRIEKRAGILEHKLGHKYSAVQLTSIEDRVSSLVLSYLIELRGEIPVHLGPLKRYSIEAQLLMDDATRINLDLLPKKKGDVNNLFSVMDQTKTTMGRRLLYQTIKGPSTDKAEIEHRQQMVDELLQESSIRQQIRDMLASCYDLEKLTALTAANRLSPRSMGRLRDCLLATEQIINLMRAQSVQCVKSLVLSMPDLSFLRKSLVEALADVLPLNIKDGGVFRDGYDPELDELRNLIRNGKELLLNLETKEKEQTLIPSLKIKYTRVFGYYIEVTRTHLDKVPKHYQRKQTIANGERFVTPELNELEVKLTSAESKALDLEERKFEELRQEIARFAGLLMETGRLLSCLDLMACFAELAAKRSLVRPQMLEMDAGLTNIRAGRHPIIENICLDDGSYFVPNDVCLNKNDCSLMLITGPNMAGKSTIMRQVALVQIMAQMGAFVPAKQATLSICDAIFARVGASDDMSTGRSTFMVEMTETAAILNQATQNSLIILDEIGRGTSTYDGMSIAHAVVEYIHNILKARTLFATHYHELTQLEKNLIHLKNFHVRVLERPTEIKFLYALGPGACLKSFGIQVARLSGLPPMILDRAQEVLLRLENSAHDEGNVSSELLSTKMPECRPQLDLFSRTSSFSSHFNQDEDLVNKILAIDINRLTPLQALNKLSSWQTILKKAVRAISS